MFWIKLDALRPYLTQQSIFIDDDNNLPKYTFDDFFQLGMYDGEIYKTRNLRNLSLMQMHPDPDDLKQAQDSIENRLKAFEQRLWMPSREELQAKAQAEEEARLKAEGKMDDVVVEEREEKKTNTRNTRSVRQKKETKKESTKKKKSRSSSIDDSNSSSSRSGVTRSVRRTR